VVPCSFTSNSIAKATASYMEMSGSLRNTPPVIGQVLSVALLDVGCDCWSVIAQLKLPTETVSLSHIRSQLLQSGAFPNNQFVFYLNDHPVVQGQEPFIDAHHLLPVARIAKIPDSIPVKPMLMSTPSYEASIVGNARAHRTGSIDDLDQKLNDVCYECPPAMGHEAIIIDIPVEIAHPEHSLHLAAHDSSVRGGDDDDADSGTESPLLDATRGPAQALSQLRRRMPSRLNQESKLHRSGFDAMHIGDEDIVRRLSDCLDRDPKMKFDVSLMNPQGETIRFKSAAELLDYLDKSMGTKASKPLGMGLPSPPIVPLNVGNPPSPSGAAGSKMKFTDDSFDPNVIWIDVEGAQVSEIEKLGKRFELHPLTIEDCCASGGRQKLEPFENYLFLVFKSLHHDYYSWDIDNPIKVLVFSNIVLTFHRYPSFAIHIAMQRVIKVSFCSVPIRFSWKCIQLYKSNYLKVVESTHVLHTIADSICDTDVPVVNAVEDETDVLEEFVYGENSIEGDQDLLQQIGLTKRRLARFRQLLWPKRDIVLSLVQREYLDTLRSKINVAYFRDVYDHLVIFHQLYHCLILVRFSWFSNWKWITKLFQPWNKLTLQEFQSKWPRLPIP
jgi:Mg2+ and Co2+ transporter CorA